MPEPKLLSHFYVKLGGADPSEEFMRALVEVVVESSLHLPDVATLVVHDPRLKWVDDGLLAPGQPIEISSSQSTSNSRSAAIFDGEIVELEPEFGSASHRLVARAFDRLHRLSRGRIVRSFQNVSDSDIVEKIAKEIGLKPDVEPTRAVYPYLLQNNETNFDFLRKRANAAGYLLYASGKTLCFKPLESKDTPIELKWGVNLNEFRPRLTTINQVNTVSARGWDPETRTEILGQSKGSKGMPKLSKNIEGGDLSRKAFNIVADSLVSSPPIQTQADADHIAQVKANRHAETFVEAAGICLGNPAIIAGASVKLEGLGDHFTGTYFVTAATHVYNVKKEYSTDFSISGEDPSTLLGMLRTSVDVGSSQNGLAIGIVTDNNDPKGWGRVKVKFPWLTPDHTSDWARVVVPGGGAQRGLQFLPEVSDEVLVGFEMCDIHHPFIIGGLWNGKDSPPKKNSEIIQGGKVQQRIICSRAGHCITLDDSTESPGITIEDKSGDRIVFNSRNKTLTLESKGDATLNVEGNLVIKAKGQVSIEGAGIKVDGGSANVDVTGGMINLN